MDPLLLVIICVVGASLYFEFTNGWNDSANAIATVVATRVLEPYQAILIAALLNFLGALGGQAVAQTIAHSIIKPEVYNTVPAMDAQIFVLAAVLAAAIWITIVTRMGVPVSGSHSLLGGMLGAGVAMAGFHAVKGSGLVKVVLALLLSPIFGLIVGFATMAAIMWLFRKVNAGTVNKWFGKLQIFSVSWMAFEHGRNDAQKTMGIITLALMAGAFVLPADEVWTWESGQWQKIESRPGISIGSDYSSAYDEINGRMVLLAAARGQLKAFSVDKDGWQEIADVPPGPFESTPLIAFDTKHQQLVLYGMTSSGGETWLLEGGKWHAAAAGDSPPARSMCAMAHDPGRGVTVLFGGKTPDGQALGDTWEWDGAEWHQVESERKPQPRFGHAMCFDPESQQVMLFGGKFADGTLAAGTWTWDGNDWKRLEPEISAPALIGAVLCPDLTTKQILLFGGKDSDGKTSTDTWIWDGNNWSRAETASPPSLRTGFTLAMNGALQRPFLYGAVTAVPAIPIWVILICAVTMAIGTAAGGWKVMATMGQGLVKLRPVHGFAAETSASIVLMGAASFGLPVSTTHTITAAIMGVGTTQRVSAVRWGLGRKLVYAWIYTFPATMAVSALIYLICRVFFL